MSQLHPVQRQNVSIRVVFESEHSTQFLLTQLTAFSLKPYNVLSKFQNQ